VSALAENKWDAANQIVSTGIGSRRPWAKGRSLADPSARRHLWTLANDITPQKAELNGKLNCQVFGLENSF